MSDVDFYIKDLKDDCAIVRFRGRDFNVSLKMAESWVETMEKTDPEDYALQIRRFKKIVYAIETGTVFE